MVPPNSHSSCSFIGLGRPDVGHGPNVAAESKDIEDIGSRKVVQLGLSSAAGRLPADGAAGASSHVMAAWGIRSVNLGETSKHNITAPPRAPLENGHKVPAGLDAPGGLSLRQRGFVARIKPHMEAGTRNRLVNPSKESSQELGSETNAQSKSDSASADRSALKWGAVSTSQQRSLKRCSTVPVAHSSCAARVADKAPVLHGQGMHAKITNAAMFAKDTKEDATASTQEHLAAGHSSASGSPVVQMPYTCVVAAEPPFLVSNLMWLAFAGSMGVLGYAAGLATVVFVGDVEEWLYSS